MKKGEVYGRDNNNRINKKDFRMSISYKKSSQASQSFLRLFGIKVEELDKILKEVEPLWEKTVTDGYKRPGRA
ncbi:hypothetical protein Sarmat_01108 [Rickettsiales endosymbiont of Paramecium tredecaurelia]|nr:hypothetical protein [Candidatus Sarmatiella mevalonica]